MKLKPCECCFKLGVPSGTAVSAVSLMLVFITVS